ncbi:putative nuclease HARBI1 [Bactrocera tryoni]|uniref:putative nuclease HARBI1 n=1 Tax=Bactrocera tryoni TaxID=59916 RepID=UPI001A99D0D2|nr:putative nuclease HARBI1 [Bactrocera tryoni]
MARALVAALLIEEILEMEKEEEIAKSGKKKRIWVQDWRKKRPKRSHTNLLKELEISCPKDYKNFLRMDVAVYNDLLALITPLIEKQDTIMRDAISPNERLSVTLRFLATGESYESLKFPSRIATPTLSKIIIETCESIVKVLKDFISMPKNEEEWKIIATEFFEMWNFPNCLGAIDGKHINIKRPPHSGAYYFNYKKTYSIVLMALVNAKYQFTMVEVGANGRVSDGDVYGNSNFAVMHEERKLKISPPVKPHGFDKELPFVFVADDAFALHENFMKPYSHRGLTHQQLQYNYRVSRARRVVENAFGIMSSRFRILLTTINLSPEKCSKIVLAICYLHNFLSKRSSASYLRRVEENDKQFIEMAELQNTTSRNYSNKAMEIRNIFCEYFNSVGSLEN